MQISHYNSFLYIFVGMVATMGIYLSRSSGEGQSNFFNGGKPSFWVVSALSLFAGTIFQFWILLLPVLSLSLTSFLIIFSLIISILLPILLLKDKYTNVNPFMELLSSNVRTILFAVVIVFFAVIQPFALLYLAEKIIAQFLGGSYHFLLVFLIGAAGLITLIGGKKIIGYANAMFGLAVIASMLEIMYLSKSVSAPLMFLQMLFTEGTTYIQDHKFFETNWVIGFVGFSVITWWMWWIDNSAYQLQEKQSEQRNSVAALFASFSLIVIALVVFPTQGYGETTRLNVPQITSILVNNELLSFFFVLSVVSVVVSSFSHSFQTIATLVVVHVFREEIRQHVEEKHVLIARLVIVLAALLTILYIPFAQFFGVVTLVVYVQYLACFAASMVGAFTVFVFFEKHNKKNAIATGVIGGMGAGILIIVLTYGGSEILTPFLTTPYGAATGIFIFSILCSIAGSFLGEKKIARSSAAV